MLYSDDVEICPDPAKAGSNLCHVADLPQVSSSTMFLLAGMFLCTG